MGHRHRSAVADSQVVRAKRRGGDDVGNGGGACRWARRLRLFRLFRSVPWRIWADGQRGDEWYTRSTGRGGYLGSGRN